MLWVDKYRPDSIDTLDYHPEVSRRLKNLAESDDLPHLLVYGPSGGGKKTRIMALLRELYGDNVLKVRLEHKTFQAAGKSTKVEITTVASNYHIEMNPSDVGNSDRLVVQEVLKEIAQYHLADSNSKKNFKVVLLMEVDRLSKNAQHALRRTMEKYTATCRLILCCNNPSKVIDPLRSRCLGIRVGAPTSDEIITILKQICHKEGLNYENRLGNEIAIKSERNLRRAVLMLETCHVQQYPFTSDQQIQLPAWEDYICSLAKDVLQDQSPGALLKAREKIYELLSNCIPSEVILKVLCRELMSRLDDDLKHELIQWAAFYEHRMQRGSKEIFHFEAFLAKFMTLFLDPPLTWASTRSSMTELTTLPNNGRGKEVLNKWELYIVSRLISFQSLLSISDRVNTGLLFSPYEMKASKNDVEKNILIQPSNHLERWKKWKLDNEKIERLTKVAMNIEKNEILKFFEEKLDKFRFFARGKRGILFAGERKEDQLPVVVKLSAENGNPMTIKPIDIEAKWISILNRVGIGARLLARGTGWFMCERLNGQPICDFLSSASREEAKWAIRELLCQCFTMDRLGINKDEMTHPNRHIIIHQQTISFPRKDPRLVCTFIDFEKCSFTSKPKNITQICQFLCSPYMTKLLSERGIVNDVMKMRQCTKAYKQTPSSKTFQVIMKHFQL